MANKQKDAPEVEDVPSIVEKESPEPKTIRYRNVTNHRLDVTVNGETKRLGPNEEIRIATEDAHQLDGYRGELHPLR